MNDPVRQILAKFKPVVPRLPEERKTNPIMWPDGSSVDYTVAARYADEWMSIGITKGEIKHRLRKMAGVDLSARTLERVLARAKRMQAFRTGLTMEELRFKAADVYQSVISGDSTSPRDRVRAQEALDKLWGVQAPTQHHHTGKVSISQDEAEALLTNEQASDLLDTVADLMYQRQTPSEN